jgi:hypothetical protein
MHIRNYINQSSANLMVLLCLLFTAQLQADAASQAHDVINKAIEVAGGIGAWQRQGTLIAHETQTRYGGGEPSRVSLVHYLNTKGDGYRLEITRSDGKFVYGWDGRAFWALVNGKPGDADQVREARRTIADAYYRFSLPFILDDSKVDMEYTGTESFNGSEVDVVKITYNQGAANRYFPTQEADQGNTSSMNHDSSSAPAAHSSPADHEVYFYSINKSGIINKVYFSHHGDGSYETLLLDDYDSVGGILKEHYRKVLLPDGKTLYESDIADVSFSEEIGSEKFSKPYP